MAQAVVDPAEMRRFAHNLKVFTGEVQNQSSTLRAQLNSLGQSWRDQEQVKFAEEFEQAMTVINRFIETANQHIPFLIRKAERVEEYLHQR